MGLNNLQDGVTINCTESRLIKYKKIYPNGSLYLIESNIASLLYNLDVTVFFLLRNKIVVYKLQILAGVIRKAYIFKEKKSIE